MLLWLMIACGPKEPPPAAAAAAAPVEAQAPAAAPAPAPKPKVQTTKAAKLPDYRLPDTGVVDPNAWRRKYNDAIRLQNAGDTAGAYKAALDAVAFAIPEERGDALVMLALTAGEAGDRPMEFAAADALLADAEAPWEIFWNAALDANGEHDYERSAVYAVEALERGGDPELVRPFAVSILKRIGRCAEAQKIEKEVECA